MIYSLHMEMFINITSQGQISIPAKLRKSLGFSKKIIVRAFDNKIILEPVPDLLSMGGILESKAKKGKTIKEIIKEEKKAFASSFNK